MDELARQLEAARDDLSPRWDADRAARLYSGVGQLRRRRRAGRVVAAGAVAAMAVAVGLNLEDGAGSQQIAAPSAPTAAAGDTIRSGHRVRLADGSTASMVGERSELELLDNDASRIRMRLSRGQAHFDVVPNPARSFEVEAGPYRVVVLGTVFDVQRTQMAVRVAVSRGKVRVYGPHGASDLPVGESRSFPLDVEPPPPSETAETAEAAEAPAAPEMEVTLEEAQTVHVPSRDDAAARKRARESRGAQPSWRTLSQSGDYEAAYASLRRVGNVDNDPAVLMDAADAARLSGHPASAVRYLERVVRDHRRSPVAPLAAFTLGRVYLDQLGQPHRAAEAFQLARTLAPSGSLAQDALAREVEAHSKGGDAHQAWVRAREYLKRYPKGRRLRAVELYGGL
jgi:transmembrane sensor